MEESKGKKFSNWMQDNLQAIIIIAIALFILFFLIYSYSKKSNTKETIVDDKDQQEEVIDEIPTDSKGNDSISEAATTNSVKTESTDANSANTESTNSESTDANSKDAQSEETTSPTNESPENINTGKGPSTTKVEISNDNQQKDGAITVTADYGESLTHLARKATAQYISENNVENLTPAHKIYIEDTLQKNVLNKTVTPGTSVSFSNNSISSAINSANSLNDYQLQNLNSYANHVSGL